MYRLADRGDYWHATSAEHLTKQFGMKTVASDMPLFFGRARGQLTELIATYADDTLACGDSSFLQMTKKTRKRFEVNSREYDNMRSSRVYFNRSDNGFNIHQPHTLIV